MVLRHNDSRRRRIVVDPNNQGGEVVESVATKPSRRRKGSLYKTGADRRSQWKTTDLLPKRGWAITIIVMLLALSLVGLNLLCFYSARWWEYLGSSGVSSLQLSGRSTLSAWFSSFLLIISGFASLQIYALRQHRQDDYRGSYRLWLWMAGLLLLASVNCIVDLTTMSTQMIHGLTRLSLSQSLVGVVAIKLVLLSALIARGSFEVRESKGATMLVVLVWVAYGAAATLRLPVLQPTMANVDEPIFQFTHGNFVLLGTIFLLIAHLVFARFVYLQALGVIKPQVSKAKKSKSSAKESSKAKKAKASKTVSHDTSDEVEKSANKPAQKPSPSVLPNKLVPKVSEIQSNDSPQLNSSSKTLSQANRSHYEDENQDDERILKLSKAEQRRQRKQQQSANRRAA